MNFIPTADYLLVKRIPPEEVTTDGGILLPNTTEFRSFPQGVVVEHGCDATIGRDVTVLYKAFNTLRLGAEIFDIVSQKDVVGYLK